MDAKRTSARQRNRCPLSLHAIVRGEAILLVVFACWAIFSDVVHSQGTARRAASVPDNFQLEKQTLELINRDRLNPFYGSETRGRARPLLWDDRLAAVARTHSSEMARERFFSHQGPDGASPAQRISAAGIQWTRVGENIAACQSIGQAESTFMDEPKFERNHRWNILNPDYNRVGIGIVKSSDGTLYITEDFVQLR